MNKLKIARDGYLLFSLVCILAGISCLLHPWLHPWENAFAVCMVGGIVLIAYGIIKITGYLSDDPYCLAFQYDLACGLFLIALGCIVMFRNLKLFPYFYTGLGLLVLMESVLTVQTAKDAKVFGLKEWQIILALSCMAGFSGALLLLSPNTGSLTWKLTGCTLLAEGIMKYAVVHFTVKTHDSKLGGLL